jgi:hypothetical protein
MKLAKWNNTSANPEFDDKLCITADLLCGNREDIKA